MIKHLLCLSVLVAPVAHADGVIAEAKTPHSTVALTDIPCYAYPNSKIAYNYNHNGNTVMGCWVADESRVVVAWNDLRLMTYSHNFFNVKEIK